MKKLLNAVAMAGALLGASTAGAGTLVTNWGFTVNTQWTAATFTSNVGTQTQNASEITWGGGGAYTNPNLDPTAASSALVISNNPANGVVATNTFPGPPPAYGLSTIVTHYNNTLDGSFGSLATATVNTALTLTPLTPAGPNQVIPPQVFSVKFKETTNTSGGCLITSVSVCDDIFVLETGNLTQGFDYDGYHYTVQIFDVDAITKAPPGRLRSLTDEECALAGSAFGCIGFTTQEKTFTPTQFAFFINAVPVPEPSSLALFAAALFAMGASVRRKSSR
jgi:PEP-CTERM motif